MEQYISKSALIAEIEKRIAEGEKVVKGLPSSAIMGLIQAYKNTLSFLDTLEVKEVQEEPVSEELKKIKQKSSWSEEDEINLEKAIWYVENPAPMVVKDSMLVEWLKSLKQRINV